LDFVGRIIDRPVDIAFSDWRAGDQRYFVADSRAAENALDLSPKVQWQDGVTRLAQWLAAEGGINLPIGQVPLVRSA
jgi:CDP-paratose 2-epimerase